MKIYLDTCCYNRQFDVQNQQRIHDETNAIFSIIARSKNNGDIILGSDILIFEFSRNPNEHKRNNLAVMFHNTVQEMIPVDDAVLKKFDEIRRQSNIHSVDGLHLACAEIGNADIFLTTDDKFIKACKKLTLSVRVMNPVSYLAEVFKNDGY